MYGLLTFLIKKVCEFFQINIRFISVFLYGNLILYFIANTIETKNFFSLIKIEI